MEINLRLKVTDITPKVYEIGPCFRQEKEDETHRVEFYMMELYSRGEKLVHMIELMKNISQCCIPFVKDVEIFSVKDFMLADLGVDIATLSTDELIEHIPNCRPTVYVKGDRPFALVNRYIEQFVEPALTKKDCLYFLVDYPISTICVANRTNGTNCIERFECFINGLEISHAFEDSIQADDIEMRTKQSRIMSPEIFEQIRLTREGRVAATVGLGIGIDRLCMLYRNC